MACNFTHQSVARDDVAFNDLAKVFELVIADEKFFADRCSLRFVLLNDVDVNKMLFEEFPGKSDVVFTSS